MSSSSELLYRVNSAYKSSNVADAKLALNNYLISNCYNPTKRRIFDAHMQKYRDVLVPCGSCYHCIESKINEWVTRMYAHLEDYKYAYFVTLTYRPFTVIKDIERLLLAKLSQACYHYDDLNTYHRLSYNPCLLVKKHYQDFFKRLRKNTGIKDLTYVVSGEYGKKYGRPHWHTLIFTNTPINRNDIVKAWSVALWRSSDGSFTYKRNQKFNGQSFYFPIGRVDFNDLVSNGTLNTTNKVNIDGTLYSGSYCFSYVCKYVCKRDSFNFNRLLLAFNSLFERKVFTRLYDKDVPYEIAKEYCEKNYLDTYFNDSLKQLCYEKIIAKNDPNLFSDFIFRSYQKCVIGFKQTFDYFPNVYHEFKHSFAPFVEFSRGTPIGSKYADRHLQEFKDGVYKKPLLQEKSFVVPRYFVYKAKNSFYGIREVNKTIKGKSLRLGRMVDIYRQLSSGNYLSSSLIRILPDWYSDQNFNEVLSNGRYVYKQVHKKVSILLHKGKALFFKYSRKFKKYLLVDTSPLSDFINSWICDLESEFYRHSIDVSRSSQNMDFIHRSFSLCSELGIDIPSFRFNFISTQDKFIGQRQLLYDFTHLSIE